MDINFTRHATSRWEERFPALIKEKEWDSALPASKSVLKKIRQQCPLNAGKVGDKKPFYRYLLSTNMVIFVYDMSGVVITVFPLSLPATEEGYGWRVARNKGRFTVELRKKRN